MTDEIDLPGIPNCAYHPDQDSVDQCSVCDRPVCGECVSIFGGADLCPPCRRQREADLRREGKRAQEELSGLETKMQEYLLRGSRADFEYRGLDLDYGRVKRRISEIGRILGA